MTLNSAMNGISSLLFPSLGLFQPAMERNWSEPDALAPATQPPLDLEPALQTVRRMPAFQPPRPNWAEDLLKLPWIQKGFHLIDQFFKLLQHAIGKLFGSLLSRHINSLPPLMKGIFSGTIIFFISLIGLAAIYWLINLFIGYQQRKIKKAQGSSKSDKSLGRQLAAYHQQQAIRFAQEGAFAEGIREWYKAALCLFNDHHLVPHDESRTSGEYTIYLNQKNFNELSHPFRTLITRFEAVHFAEQAGDQQGWQISQSAFEQIQREVETVRNSEP